MRKIYETAVILIGTLGWWGFVYPELCFTEETCGQESDAGQLETDEMARIGTADQVGEGQREAGNIVFWEADQAKPGSAAKEEASQIPEGDVRINAGRDGGESGDGSIKSERAGGLWLGDVCIKSRLVEYLYQRGR